MIDLYSYIWYIKLKQSSINSTSVTFIIATIAIDLYYVIKQKDLCLAQSPALMTVDKEYVAQLRVLLLAGVLSATG